LTRLSSLALMLPLALLAGCHKSPKNDARSASGEVLQGTTSDAMLPLDKLKSQPPLLAPSHDKSTPEGVADEASGVADATSGTSGAPEDQPTSTPVPAVSASGTP
jgi:hypothetical protein